MKRKLALLYNNTNSYRLVKLLRFSFTTRSRMTSKSSSNAEDDPQCNLVSSVGLDSLSLNKLQPIVTSSESSTSKLESLSDDLLLNVLLYCGPTEVEESVKLVSRRLHNATSLSTLLWKEFCILTGKALDAQFATENELTSSVCVVESSSVVVVKEDEKQQQEDDDVGSDSSLHSSFSTAATTANDNLYRLFYFRNPCVPVDFDTINEALKHCPRTKLSTKATTLQQHSSSTQDSIIFSETATVVLMPGVYDERVDISGEPWSVGQATFDKSIAIRASFPLIGATIRSPNLSDNDEDVLDQPCISISTRDEETVEGVQKGISVRLSHLRILHSTPGANIWGGNTAINIEGPRARVIIDSCVLQSDSGRGLVVTTQAVCELYQTSIINCAATGFYLGDWGSRARISGCNILRNGFGSKRRPSSSTDDQADRLPVVPSGHSGVYIESSMCWIDDSLLSGNCLTGLSVVRGGFVSLSGSDFTENGQQAAAPPILIEDAHDVRANTNNRMQQQGGPVSIRGGVVEGPVKNNYTSMRLEVDEGHVVNGGILRGGGGTTSSWTRQSLT